MKYKLFLILILSLLLLVANYLYQSFQARREFANSIHSIHLLHKTCPAYFIRVKVTNDGIQPPPNVVMVALQDYVIDVHGKVRQDLWRKYVKEKAPDTFLNGFGWVDNSSETATVEAFKKKRWASRICSVENYLYSSSLRE